MNNSVRPIVLNSVTPSSKIINKVIQKPKYNIYFPPKTLFRFKICNVLYHIIQFNRDYNKMGSILLAVMCMRKTVVYHRVLKYCLIWELFVYILSL